MSIPFEIKLHCIATDGLPSRHTQGLTDRIAFIFDGCVVSGWPVCAGDPLAPHYTGEWEADTDVGRNARFQGVTHWLEFPVPISMLALPQRAVLSEPLQPVDSLSSPWVDMPGSSGEVVLDGPEYAPSEAVRQVNRIAFGVGDGLVCDGIAVGDQDQSHAECGLLASHDPHPLAGAATEWVSPAEEVRMVEQTGFGPT